MDIENVCWKCAKHSNAPDFYKPEKTLLQNCFKQWEVELGLYVDKTIGQLT